MSIILWPHLAKVRCVTRPPTRGNFSFCAKFGQHQLLDMQLSSVIIHFLNAYSMSITANTTYMASFPKRPNIMGAPDQVFKFHNFLDLLIGGIKASTISAIRTINLRSLPLKTKKLLAKQIVSVDILFCIK
jgi:hypothetical protein